MARPTYMAQITSVRIAQLVARFRRGYRDQGFSGGHQNSQQELECASIAESSRDR